ncbi:ribosome biogenesis GTPase YlqF [Bombilactobacillus bombi]|uniref:ribosome biogenesis GTPase YlqF n=1 Tax=Bombilactobacillus bombi TaxID=1303590 RepID=UPI0015E5E30B|nr:ribosome biogenesis GTPase YlqF [Bombilactobacillus bombi]MBA1435174.1 ribosome biogenesis GTPase YlqF [Bombilactobacillus bombi]
MTIIQWYPGHMNKAKNQIQDRLKLVDVVLEIRDARLPLSSANPVLDQLIQNKKRLIILNKKDLADASQTKKWQQYFQNPQVASVAIDAQHTQHLQIIIQKINQLMAAKLKKFQQSGVQNYTIRAMCIGIPNVGKSTVLNKLAGKNIAVTGNRPGVTKNQNWIKTKSHIELLDTPGVLWPKIDDETVGIKLALSGAIKDSLVPQTDIALFALDFFQKHYPQLLQAAYHLTTTDLQENNKELFLHLCQQFNMADDYERSANKLIQDLRKGIWGQYTLDWVQEIDS